MISFLIYIAVEVLTTSLSSRTVSEGPGLQIQVVFENPQGAEGLLEAGPSDQAPQSR